MEQVANYEDGKKDFRRAFVAGVKKNQDKANIYEKKFAKLDNGNVSWNWCAFLFTGLWLLYRKMYKVFLIFLAASVVASGIANAIVAVAGAGDSVSSTVSYVVAIALSVVMGIMGDKIYLNRIDGFYGAPNPNGIIAKYGGTTLKGIVVYLAIVVAIAIVTAVILLLFSAATTQLM